MMRDYKGTDLKCQTTICLCMIVKNESTIITQCLDNLIKFVDYVVVCDTGSTDGTQTIITQYLQNNNIAGELFEDEWKNFAHNRTIALTRSRDKATFSMVFDADDEFMCDNNEIILDPTIGTYNMKLNLGSIVYYRPILLNNKYEWMYRGVIHEYACTIDDTISVSSANLDGASIICNNIGISSRNVDLVRKYENDRDVLLNVLVKEPANSRYMFYLGQTYESLKDYGNAQIYYSLCRDNSCWDEEIYYATYRCGLCKIFTHSFKEAESYLWAAYVLRPLRLESLYEIVKHYRLHNPRIAYGFARMAYYGGLTFNIPKDALFVNHDIYKFRMLDELAVCAYWVENFQLAYEINVKLLDIIHNDKVDLSLSRIQANLKFCSDKLQETVSKSQ